MSHFLYVLKSKSRGRRYIGITKNLEKRLARHNQGGTRSTKPYKPWIMLHTEEFSSKTDARKREIELKTNNKKRALLYKKIDGPIV